jgi:hypothetical protein
LLAEWSHAVNTARLHNFTLSLAALMLTMVTSPAAAQNYLFSRADYAVGSDPQSVAVGDFNRDGRPDIVVANSQGFSVSVVLSNSEGTFQTQVQYAVGGFPSGVAVGDFNRDGKLDIAVSTFSGVSVLLGNGDGTFKPYVSYSTTGTPWAIATGDFNKDGNLDLAVADESGSDVEILLGNGKGGFGSPTSYTTGSSPRMVVVADFNNDGFPDLATANSFGASVSVLLNTGKGTFAPNVDYATGSGCISVATGDLRHLGRMDLVAGVQGLGQVWVLLSNGDGTFEKGVSYTAGSELAAFVALGDFNGDGKLDVAVTSEAGGGFVSVLLGNGDGTLQASLAFGTGSFPYGIAAADFNGDGKIDIVTANDNTPGSVSVLLSGGSTVFIPRTDYPIGNATNAIINADVNGDGKPDLILADNLAGLVSVLTNKGNGTFNTHVDYPAGNEPVALAAGDFNNDHHIDLVVANETSSDAVSVLLNKGNGTFGSATSFSIASPAAGVAVGDFNMDGNLDIVATDFTTSQISVLLGKGNGTFQTHVDYTTGGFPTGVTVGDFNGDGWPDVAVANESSGTVSIFLNKADHTGTLLPKVDYPAIGSPTSIATASFRGNGILDLVVATNSASGAAVLLGNGNGTFQAPVAYSTDNNAVSVTTGDFNNDGKLDLAVAVTDNGNFPGLVTVMLGQGDGTFPTQLTYATGQTPFGVTAADFNLDGGLDLAMAIGAPGDAASVLLNDPVVAFLPTKLIFPNEQVGSTSAAQTITISNPGVTPLAISSVATSGDFAQTDTCPLSPSTLLTGANCPVNVTFTPSAEGKRTGNLTLKDNAASGYQNIPLVGTGLAPVASLSSTSLTFATQLLNTTSPPQNMTLTNTGNQTLNITSIAASGNFAESNTCPSSLAVNANCTITVTFTPMAINTLTGTVTVTDNAPNSPQTISLTGTGTEVELSVTSINFGSQKVGTTSALQKVTMTNVGTTTMNITGITVVGTNMGDFAEKTTCGATLAKGASCLIGVTFTPMATGARSASVSISDNGGGSPQTIALTGTGT